ncbi:MAG: glucokinase [Rhizobiaceae bacterium]
MSEQLAQFEFPVLVGDIGGTNARFALIETPRSEPRSFGNVQTADFANIDLAIRDAILPQTTLRPKTAILAIAGPISGDEIELTNCPWVVRPFVMMEMLGLKDIVVINDFEAQALAVASLGKEHLAQIGGGEPDDNASRVVLGPGTGLGVAGLVRTGESWLPIPGEGGHVDMGPRTPRDYQIFPHIELLEGRISGEQILCGRGLVSLYRAICEADGLAPVHNTPKEVTEAAFSGNDKAASEAIELFATYLGRLAGDLALVFMARGGVYLSGGIAQKIISVLQNGGMRAAFDDKAPHSEFMRSLPVFVVTHPLAAVAGLSAYARDPAKFNLNLHGKRWNQLA